MKYFWLFISILFLTFSFVEGTYYEYVYTYVDDKIIDNSVGFIETDSFVFNAVDNEEDSEEMVPEVLESQVGKLSGYGPDCYGCSGYLAYGDYVGDGRVYYQDMEYGNVRIVAGDHKYPFGTIVRVNIHGKDPFLAIVLDRGGAIGFSKTALFDLLYPSEYLANLDGVFYNTKFEVLRYGF